MAKKVDTRDFNFERETFSLRHINEPFITSEGRIDELLNSINQDDFERTSMAIKNSESVILDRRSSWTYNKKIRIDHPYFKDMEFQILKYKEGDFFELHKDSRGTHTCLIFCPSDFVGGNLVLKMNDTWELKVNPDKMNCYTVLTFSTDFLHEVLPITQGTRYVLKSFLNFVKPKKKVKKKKKKKTKETNESEDDEEYIEWDGGLDCACDYGDY